MIRATYCNAQKVRTVLKAKYKDVKRNKALRPLAVPASDVIQDVINVYQELVEKGRIYSRKEDHVR